LKHDWGVSCFTAAPGACRSPRLDAYLEASERILTDMDAAEAATAAAGII
jgi:hypothetical protein